MKFRRIYWVTEQLDEAGRSAISGVYTSIPDLIEGLRWDEALDKRAGFRINLVKLDAKLPPLGTWTSPGFGNLAADLKEYVSTGEFSQPDCDELVVELGKLAG